MTEPGWFDTDSMPWTTHPQFPHIEIKILETRATHPHLSMMRVRLAAGGEIALHHHEQAIETVYVISGAAILFIESTPYALKPGVVASVPAGAAHRLLNDDGAPLELLAIHAPPVR